VGLTLIGDALTGRVAHVFGKCAHIYLAINYVVLTYVDHHPCMSVFAVFVLMHSVRTTGTIHAHILLAVSKLASCCRFSSSSSYYYYCLFFVYNRRVHSILPMKV
jgi:hypothetical protein